MTTPHWPQPRFSVTDAGVAALLSTAPSALTNLSGHLQNYAEDLATLRLEEVDPLLLSRLWGPLLESWVMALDGRASTRDCAWAFQVALRTHPELLQHRLGPEAQARAERRALDALTSQVSQPSPLLGFLPLWNGLVAAWPRLFPALLDRWLDLAARCQAARTSLFAYFARIVFDPAHDPFVDDPERCDRPWATAGPVPQAWSASSIAAVRKSLSLSRLTPSLDGLPPPRDEWQRVLEAEVLATLPKCLPERVEELLAHLQDPSLPDYWATELGLG